MPLNNAEKQDLGTAWLIIAQGLRDDPEWRKTVVDNVAMTIYDAARHGVEYGEFDRADADDPIVCNQIADYFVRNFFETKGGDK